MLKIIPDHNYIVYPSWAKPDYRWEDLPRLFSDPIASGYLEPGRSLEFYWNLGFSRVPQPFSLMDGPCGGGIIRWEGDPNADRGGRWLPIAILFSQANLRLPPGMELGENDFDPRVRAIEPHGGGGLVRHKIYRCGASVEHVESAGQSVYWILCASNKGRKIKGLESLPAWARSFGLAVAPLADIPAVVSAETESWFLDPSHGRIWFEVNGGGNDVGYHFAVLVYLAYHLRWFAGRTIFSMHLVADIEGKPNARQLWKV